MDIFSHAAWGATIIREPEKIGWAALSGALPDLLPAIFGFIKYGTAYDKKLSKMAEEKDYDNAYFKVYHFCHSFVPITIVTAALYFLLPNYWYVTAPYYLHIILDIMTHERIWATQILYPISNFSFKFGKNWWQYNWISYANWGVLILINLILFL